VNLYRLAWGGVQWKSSSIIDADWLQIHGEALSVNKTFVNALGTAQNIFKDSFTAWFNLRKQTLLLSALQDDEAIKARTARRERQAAALTPKRICKRSFDSWGRSVWQTQTSSGPHEEDLLKNDLAATIVPDQKDLADLLSPTLEPEGPAVVIDRQMLDKAASIPELLKKEGYTEKIPQLDVIPNEQEYNSALVAHFAGDPAQVPSVPDIFAPGGNEAFRKLFRHLDLPTEAPTAAPTDRF